MGSEQFYHNTLQVVAQKRHNNTVVTCAVLDTSHQLMKSDAIKIIVMGKSITIKPLRKAPVGLVLMFAR